MHHIRLWTFRSKKIELSESFINGVSHGGLLSPLKFVTIKLVIFGNLKFSIIDYIIPICAAFDIRFSDKSNDNKVEGEKNICI